MPDLADTIRDRVYVALARALGDEAAAATAGEGDLIAVGTFDGHPVHLEFGVDVVLWLEEADHTLVQLDVSEQPPLASSRVVYQQAYQVALEAVGERFLRDETARLEEARSGQPNTSTGLWEAIHEYVRTCGGDPDKPVIGNLRRMQAVARIGVLLPECDR